MSLPGGSKVVKDLLDLAKDPRYALLPPQLFVDACGFGKSSYHFRLMAWELFKKRKGPISPADVQRYIEESEPDEGVGNRRSLKRS